jgi:hypothetical protein
MQVDDGLGWRFEHMFVIFHVPTIEPPHGMKAEHSPGVPVPLDEPPQPSDEIKAT